MPKDEWLGGQEPWWYSLWVYSCVAPTFTTWVYWDGLTLTLPFLTFRRLAVLGSMTFRISRTSCVRDDPTWPCLMMNDLGVPSERASRAFAPLRWVLVFLRLAISKFRKKSFIIQKEGYLFVSKAITKYSGSAQLWREIIFTTSTNESAVIIPWALYAHLFSRPTTKTTSKSGEIYSQLTVKPNRIHLPPQSQNLPARDTCRDWNMGRSRPPRWTQIIEKPCQYQNWPRVRFFYFPPDLARWKKKKTYCRLQVD